MPCVSQTSRCSVSAAPALCVDAECRLPAMAASGEGHSHAPPTGRLAIRRMGMARVMEVSDRWKSQPFELRSA
jgi:hypothetical protein